MTVNGYAARTASYQGVVILGKGHETYWTLKSPLSVSLPHTEGGQSELTYDLSDKM